MSIKTPLEIAEIAAQNIVARHKIDRAESENGISSLAWALGEPGLEYEAGLRELVAEVIELDRAQRAEDLETLADAAASWTAELTDYVIPGASKEDAAGYEEECETITAAIGRYLDEKEGITS